MWVHNLNPTLLDLGFLEIRYYGLVYVLGFVFALFWLLKYRREIGFSKDQVYDLVFYVILGGIVGARLFHVLFWEPAYYFADPLKILFFWEGGMAFHGGIVGGLIAAWLFHRQKKFKFWKVADLLTIPMIIVFAIGRLANFINAELPGTVTNVKWCVDFGDGSCRHPAQLYAFGKRVLVGVVLYFVSRKEHKDGFLFFLMITLLGLGRFFVDFVREDILYLGLSMGQWTSLAMFIIGLGILLKWYRQDFRKIFK
jgi:phosphatidylglycerol---prolipoprotein diacylglyceryl transferase